MPEPYLWPDNVNNVAYNPWTDLRWRRDIAKLRLKFPWEKIPGIYPDRYIYFIIYINVCARIYIFLNHFPIIIFRKVWETNYSIVLCSRILRRQYDRQAYTSATCLEDSR